jgi:hypothetical protein
LADGPRGWSAIVILNQLINTAGTLQVFWFMTPSKQARFRQPDPIL